MTIFRSHGRVSKTIGTNQRETIQALSKDLSTDIQGRSILDGACVFHMGVGKSVPCLIGKVVCSMVHLWESFSNPWMVFIKKRIRISSNKSNHKHVLGPWLTLIFMIPNPNLRHMPSKHPETKWCWKHHKLQVMLGTVNQTSCDTFDRNHIFKHGQTCWDHDPNFKHLIGTLFFNMKWC